ncbi:FAD-binding oxidoreductase [Echinimonas agarilytica]|uniref:FAD-binding oxidoreductase n=1 Tax=Echinimonas agarilytica TaxID=1215918 RepID=A0AA41W4X1_9GAMM|nr:FAD-binding oxidoreductase [Echinimonas agarilytica]MCM2678901.1 FAD-binding oxidoreductase [Echinimonas agarilytica]
MQHPIESKPEPLSHIQWLSQSQAQEAYGGSAIQSSRQLSGGFVVTKQTDVADILQWAVAHDAAVQPISSGRNWGYGSALPVADEKPIYILDLSKLKAVIDFDEQLGLVTLEPGVTQGELLEWLESRNFDYMVPVTGAGPNCSIVGNAIERGYGITPYADHFAAVTALTAYLSNGSLYRSSLSELDRSTHVTADKSFKWKVGPYLDGLFTQSNLGVVTQMTIRLAKRPKAFESFYVQFANDTDLEVAVELLQGIMRDYEGIVGSINLMDRRRILSMVANNPNGPEQHQVMTDEQCQALAKSYQVPAWMLVGSIYGTPAVVKAVRKDVRQRVRKYASRTIFSEGWLLKFARGLLSVLPASVMKDEREQLQALAEGVEIMLGKPNQVALPLAYWRNPKHRPDKSKELNPAKDECGLMWYAPLVPTKSKNMREFVNMIREICPLYGIEPLVTLTNLRFDLTDSTIPILFNAQDENAVKQAKLCIAELVDRGLDQGCVPYRMNIDQQTELLDPNAECWQLVQGIKKTMDPTNTISPNRYNP